LANTLQWKQKKAMKNIIIIFSVITTLVYGCKVQPGVATTGPESLNAYETVPQDPIGPFIVDNGQELNDTLFASIEKGLCFGNCPTYKMYIYSNGEVSLNAIRGTNIIGVYKSKVSPAQMDLILTKAKEIKFVEMKPVYDNKSVTDLPMVTTSIVLNGKRKEVKRRYDYPREIKELEKMFDNLLDGLEWVKIKEVSSN